MFYNSTSRKTVEQLKSELEQFWENNYLNNGGMAFEQFVKLAANDVFCKYYLVANKYLDLKINYTNDRD